MNKSSRPLLNLVMLCFSSTAQCIIFATLIGSHYCNFSWAKFDFKNLNHAVFMSNFATHVFTIVDNFTFDLVKFEF